MRFLLPPGAANGNHQPCFGMAGSERRDSRAAQKFASVKKVHCPSYCAISFSNFTGPSSPEGSNGEFALYGFTSAKVYFVVASGC
jgi:hypothetical protein